MSLMLQALQKLDRRGAFSQQPDEPVTGELPESTEVHEQPARRSSADVPVHEVMSASPQVRRATPPVENVDATVMVSRLATAEGLPAMPDSGDVVHHDDESNREDLEDDDYNIPATDSFETDRSVSEDDWPRDSGIMSIELLEQLENATRAAFHEIDDHNARVSHEVTSDAKLSASAEFPAAEITEAVPRTAEVVAGDSAAKFTDEWAEPYTPFYRPVIELLVDMEITDAPVDERPNDESAAIPEVVAEFPPVEMSPPDSIDPVAIVEARPADMSNAPTNSVAPDSSARISASHSERLEEAVPDEPYTVRPTSSQPSPSQFERMILERLSNVSYERVFDQLQHEIFKRTGEKAALTAVIVGPRSTPHSANLTAHLGVTLASKDQNDVLIVDANVQDQHLSQRFESHSAAGFWELCAETKDLMSFVRETAIRRLHLLACGDTSGPPGSPEGSVVELVHSFRNHFPFTFMDGGSLETPTTSLLVRHAAATVLLIASGETTESEANAAIQRIESLRGNLIGCVVAGAFKATT